MAVDPSPVEGIELAKGSRAVKGAKGTGQRTLTEVEGDDDPSQVACPFQSEIYDCVTRVAYGRL